MGNTLLEIDQKTYLNMSIDNDSVTYSKSTRRIPKINSVIKRICNGNYENIITGQNIKWWDMSFLRKKEFAQSFPAIQTREDVVNSSTTTIKCTTTEKLPSAWYGNINGSIFQYTGKTALTLTWVTWIMWVHPVWSLIKIVHKVADDCHKPHNIFHIEEDWKITPRDYLDYKYQDVSDNYRTLIEDSQDPNKYIHFNFPDDEERFWLSYYKSPTYLENDIDETEIPENYWTELVALLASWEMLRETEQWDQGKLQLTLAYSMLKEFYNNYIEEIKQHRKTITWVRRTSNMVYSRRK